MDNKEILLQLIAHFAEGKQKDFAKMIGISPQNLSLWVSRGNFDKFVVLRRFPNINISWLDKGEGDMLSEGVISQNQQEEIAFLRDANRELASQNNKLMDILSKLKI